MIIQECEECGIKRDDVEEMLVTQNVPKTQETEDVFMFLCQDCHEELSHDSNDY